MKLHHVGVVVANISEEQRVLSDALGLRLVSPDVPDPLQESRVALLADAHGLSIELIQPSTPSSPVSRSAVNGGGLAHLCYETDDLEAEIARMRKAGALLFRRPRPAVLFGGRRVAFLYVRSGVVIELVETVPRAG